MKKRKKYIYTNKKNSNRAIMSMILGIISLVSLGVVVFLSYRTGGVAAAGYGFTGLLATVFSLVGLVLGTVTVHEKNYYRFFPVAGIVLNLLALGMLGLILYMGGNV